LMSNTNSATPTSSTGTPMVTTSTPYPETTSASSSSDNGYSTSTIYETQLITITSCAPTITHCPARNTSMSMVSRPVAIVIYSTEWITISSCAAVVTDCPYRVSTRMVSGYHGHFAWESTFSYSEGKHYYANGYTDAWKRRCSTW
jgi:hypothetical protein